MEEPSLADFVARLMVLRRELSKSLQPPSFEPAQDLRWYGAHPGEARATAGFTAIRKMDMLTWLPDVAQQSNAPTLDFFIALELRNPPPSFYSRSLLPRQDCSLFVYSH